MYNVTPHGTTGKSPSELLFGRNIKDKIPSINDLVLDEGDEEAKDTDLIKKHKGKEREDAARGSKDCDIRPGDKVLVQNMINPHKLCTRFGIEEFDVVERKGNEVSIMKEGKVYRRQVTHLKKIIDSPFNNSTGVKQSFVPLTLNSESPTSSVVNQEIAGKIQHQVSPAYEFSNDEEKYCSSIIPTLPSTQKLLL